MLKKLAPVLPGSFRLKATILFAIYAAAAFTALSLMVIHLQKENFRILARESAVDAINELSRTLYNKWDPARPSRDNKAALASYTALGQMVFSNKNIAYVIFQDSDRVIQYYGKSIPEFSWMTAITKLDPYTDRILSITGSASRSFYSYPEGKVTEYLGVVYGKHKEFLGVVRVGISEKNLQESMGGISRTTIIKILSVNLLCLAAVVLLIFYFAGHVESRLLNMHMQARKMLNNGSSSEPRNVLVELGNEFEEIEKLVASLKQKFMELATTISHEFRSPMQAIAGYVDFLRRGGAGPVNAEMDKYLGIIGENAERFQGFIDNVMDLVRLDGGRLSLTCVPFAPRDVVAKTAELFSKQCEESGISIRQSAGSDPSVLAVGDQSRVFQVLVNLVSNSLKFTPSGGSIEIGVSPAGGSEVEFYVSDTGPGIPYDRQSKLFTEFYQVPDITPVRGFKGLGIGLALSKKLVEAQGGTITLQSTPGSGTRVSFMLPVKRGGAA